MKKFDNYRKNLAVLSTADSQDLSNDFIIGGIIDKFFLQFELGWKMLKELLIYEGKPDAKTASPREILKEAYKYYPCIDERIWLSMLSERHNTAHIYDGNAARILAQKILDDYIPAFRKLEESILEKYGSILETL